MKSFNSSAFFAVLMRALKEGIRVTRDDLTFGLTRMGVPLYRTDGLIDRWQAQGKLELNGHNVVTFAWG